MAPGSSLPEHSYGDAPNELILRLLRAERDRIERLIDRNAWVWSQPDCPTYSWFDRETWLSDTRVELAKCNATISTAMTKRSPPNGPARPPGSTEPSPTRYP